MLLPLIERPSDARRIVKSNRRPFLYVRKHTHLISRLGSRWMGEIEIFCALRMGVVRKRLLERAQNGAL